MAQYFIKLPNNRQGNVKTGIRKKDKKKFMHLFFGSAKLNTEEKIAYIVEVEPAGEISEYRLLKTKEGAWLNDGEDRWLRHGEATFNSAIKKAIDDYEKLNGTPHIVETSQGRVRQGVSEALPDFFNKPEEISNCKM